MVHGGPWSNWSIDALPGYTRATKRNVHHHGATRSVPRLLVCSCEVSASDEAKQMSAEVKEEERQTDRQTEREGERERRGGMTGERQSAGDNDRGREKLDNVTSTPGDPQPETQLRPSHTPPLNFCYFG